MKTVSYIIVYIAQHSFAAGNNISGKCNEVFCFHSVFVVLRMKSVISFVNDWIIWDMLISDVFCAPFYYLCMEWF